MSKKGRWVRTSLVLMLGTQLAHAEEIRQASLDAAAPQPDMNASQPDIRQLLQQVAAQSLQLAEQQRQIDESRRQLEALQQQLGIVLANPARNVKVAGPAQTYQLAQAAASSPASPDTVGQAPEPTRPSLDVATVFSQPSVLTPKGAFVFDPSLQYSYSSSDRVSVIGFSVLNAVLIGAIDVRSVNRNSWIMSLGGRYGLTDRMEVEARIPYVYRSDDTLKRRINIAAQDELFSSDGKGLGDIEVAARYQLNAPKGDAPFYIAGLRLKTNTGKDQYEVDYNTDFNLPKELPTGSGFYSLQPSLSAVLPADPAVFFGGINYAWNIKRDINTSIVYSTPNPAYDPTDTSPTAAPEFLYSPQSIGEVDPGDSFGINFGMGLAINERSSFSLGYEHTWIGKTKVDGKEAVDAMTVQLASLQMGFSYRLNKRTNLSLSIGAGLTSDTPDTTVTLRVPIKF